jgi:hypothetical protein
MKRDFLYIPLIIARTTIGYFNAFIGDLSRWSLFWEMLFGRLWGLLVGMAFLENQSGYRIIGVS